MDEINRTNRKRWNALASANVEYSRPFLDFNREQAAERIYHYGVVPDVAGQRVLLLASGGGQDSVALGLLGAQVTVLDLSDVQLERDRQAAAHHGLAFTTVQGDMRDLSGFTAGSFDLVWQAYSLNFVPSVEPVFRGVRRILVPGGHYFLQFANPFVHSIDEEDWDGKSYPLKDRYLDGEDLALRYPVWNVDNPDGTQVKMESPHEFRHTLGKILNSMVAQGFVLRGLWEWMRQDENAEPGSWAHFTQVAPPYLTTFWRLEKPEG